MSRLMASQAAAKASPSPDAPSGFIVSARSMVRVVTLLAVSILRSGMGERSFRLPHATTRSEEHTSELQSLLRISYAGFCLKKKQEYALTTPNKIARYTW